MYNASEVILSWEQKSPVTLAPELHLTEYVLLDMFTNETLINADLSDLRHGAFGNILIRKVIKLILMIILFQPETIVP